MVSAPTGAPSPNLTPSSSRLEETKNRSAWILPPSPTTSSSASRGWINMILPSDGRIPLSPSILRTANSTVLTIAKQFPFTHGHKPQSTTPAQSSTPLLPSNNRSIHVLQIPRRKLLEEYSNPVPILNPIPALNPNPILSPSLALNPNPAPNPTLTPNPSPRSLERPLKYPSLDQRPSPLLSSNLGHNSISCHSPKLPKLPNLHPQMSKNQPTQTSA